MGQRVPTARIEPGIASSLAQLDSVCELLREASGEPFRLITDQEPAQEHSTQLAPGCSLAGGGDERRREAAAELLGHVLGAEREIESLCCEILDRYEEVTLIQRLGLQLARAMDEDGVAQVVVREVTEWLHAASGEMWLRDGNSTRLAGVTADAQLSGCPLTELGPLEALCELEPWTQPAASASEAVVAVPLPAEGKQAIGVIVIRGKEGNRSFEQREIQMLTAVAALASGFLQSHRLARENWLAEHGRTSSELCRLLHPRHAPGCQGLEISARCLDGRQPGSDYHDVVRTPDGGIALSLARVSAGGPRAALHMALAKGVMQAEARSGSSPGRMLRRVNDVLSPELIRSDLFATAYVARFHPGARRVDVASAGHAIPLLVRANSRMEQIDVAGPGLGLLSAADYDESYRELAQGDVLVFYSDGFLDARNRDGNGLDVGYLGQLISTANGATADEIGDRLLGALDSHCGGRAIEHDATLVVAKVV